MHFTAYKVYLPFIRFLSFALSLCLSLWCKLKTRIMIETLEEFNCLLENLKQIKHEDKLSKHLESKLEAFIEVENLIQKQMTPELKEKLKEDISNMENKVEKISKSMFILKIIASPFILCLILMNYFRGALIHWWKFLKYGGEFNIYEKDDKKTIQHIYNKLKEIEKENELKRLKRPR